MHTRFYILLIGSLLAGILFGTVAVAQGNCDESIAIPEATKRYATGNFDDVFALLSPCTEKGFSETGRVQALKILSMTYLAIDSLQQSSKSISQLLTLNPAFEPDFSASPRYKALFRYVRESQEQVVQVTSVSKKAENILYVPATIMVLTGKDFAQRGYQDLEQVLHDLPGFDVMKGNGVGYSYFYQRGYRSIANDRTLMLIDGVEENDLVSNHILISPQYALSNIERVEVIYGPASTLYGANAFVGVINIITKNYRNQPGPSRQIGVTAHARAGGLNTHFMDGVLWGRTSDVAFSITGRIFHSDERDLSGYSQWNFDSRTAADYTGQLDITGTDANGNYRAQNYLNSSKLLTRYPNSNLYNVTYAPGTNTATALTLTQQGAQKAATLDNNLFGNTFNGQPVRFSNTKNDWMVRAKLEFKDLTISFLNWKTNEGATPWYTNKTTLSTEGSPRWITQNRAFSITYSKPFSDKFQLVNISSYLLHEINGNTNLVTYNGYYNSKLSFLELAKDSIPKATAIYQYRLSSQLRNELRLFWSPTYNVDVSSGIEVRSGQIQVNYLNSTRPYADETGSVVSNAALGGGNNFRTTDMGLYSQVTYRPTKDLKLVGGVRVDNNRVRSHNGYGTVANPRFAAIYNYSKFIFKAIYAEAFKDASFLQKYGTTSTRTLTNPGLSPERVKNLDVSAYFQATKQLSANIVGYYATYSNAVGVAQVQLETGGTTQQFQALGRREIWGIQGEANYKATRVNAWMNFTYTNPVDQDTEQRLSDVADYMVNAGGDYQILPKLHLYVSGNYVSARKTGAGTSGSFNPQQTFPAYFVMNSNLTYHNLVSGLNLQLSVNNLLDNDYSVPGVREADNTLYTNFYPQDRRYVSFGVYYTLTPKESVQK